MVYIYKFTNLINGKIYIGSTNNLKNRLREHKCHSQYAKHTYVFYNALRKYGWESFMFDVIEECCPLLRNDRENHWIKYYHTTIDALGYNMKLADNHAFSDITREKLRQASLGKYHTKESKIKIGIASKGNKYRLGTKQSDITKQKISKSQRGRKHSEEHIKNQADAQRGEKSVNYGKCLSEETKNKISIANKGRIVSAETRQKLSERQIGEKNHNFGKKQTEESNKKRSEALTGSKNHNFGKHPTEEQRRRLIEGQRRRRRRERENTSKNESARVA